MRINWHTVTFTAMQASAQGLEGLMMEHLAEAGAPGRKSGHDPRVHHAVGLFVARVAKRRSVAGGLQKRYFINPAPIELLAFSTMGETKMTETRLSEMSSDKTA
jgi:hypothetical protein